MACPYFDPGERLPGSSGSLGDLYTGLCRADSGAPWQPDDRTVADRCNLGYARGRCAHFPATGGPDSVRFSVSKHVSGIFPTGRGVFGGLPGRTARRLAAQTGGSVRSQLPAANREMTSKFVRESISESSELALPNDANGLGNVLGGKVMHLVDLAGALAALRHARCSVVTASVDHMSFLHPVRIGQLILLRSSVNRVFHTSMEVGVKVFVEDLRTGAVRHTSSAYLTFVALDADGNRIPIPAVVPESEDEKRRYEEAARRRDYRLEMRRKGK